MGTFDSVVVVSTAIILLLASMIFGSLSLNKLAKTKGDIE